MGGFPGGETRKMGSMFSELVALDILEVRAKAWTPRMSATTARSRSAALLDPLAIDAVTSIVIDAPLSLRVCKKIGVERVNLKLALGVPPRAVLNRKDFGDISLADHPCLHRE
jgi:hypothetical protein